MWRVFSLIVAAFYFIASTFALDQWNQSTCTNESRRSRTRRDVYCDARIRGKEGWIYSPNYPGRYGMYRRCDFIIERYSKDVCDVKLIITGFDVAHSIHCATDYLEIHDGDGHVSKLCGVLPAGTQSRSGRNQTLSLVYVSEICSGDTCDVWLLRTTYLGPCLQIETLHFPRDSGVLTLKFRSTTHGGGYGFAIKVKQLLLSCLDPAPPRAPDPSICVHRLTGYSSRMTSPGFPYSYSPGQHCTYTIIRADGRACQVELDFRRFELEWSVSCHKDYFLMPDGTKLCGPLGSQRRTLEFSPGLNEMIFTFYSDNHGGTGRGFDILINQKPGPCSDGAYPPSGRQCDQVIVSETGTLTSPRYPDSFGPNYLCTYSIHRPDNTVCMLELDFAFFDLGHNPGNCATGAFFELPGRSRICHAFRGRKSIEVSQYKDPVELYFMSDRYSSGRGFKIHVRQMPNTCRGDDKDLPRLPDVTTARCYQEVRGYIGYFTSSKHGRTFPKDGFGVCEYTIRKADSSICVVRLQISSSHKYPSISCLNNYIELPDASRMCVDISYPREVNFNKGSETIFLLYRGQGITEFHLIVEQQRNSCGKGGTPLFTQPSNRWSWKAIPR